MAITQNTTPGVEKTRLTTIGYLDDAAAPVAPVLKLGFKPRYVKIDNVTDRIALEWYEGMASGTAIKTLAVGTRTLEASGGVTVVGDSIGFAPLQNKQYRIQVLG